MSGCSWFLLGSNDLFYLEVSMFRRNTLVWYVHKWFRRMISLQKLDLAGDERDVRVVFETYCERFLSQKTLWEDQMAIFPIRWSKSSYSRKPYFLGIYETKSFLWHFWRIFPLFFWIKRSNWRTESKTVFEKLLIQQIIFLEHLECVLENSSKHKFNSLFGSARQYFRTRIFSIIIWINSYFQKYFVKGVSNGAFFKEKTKYRWCTEFVWVFWFFWCTIS